MSPQRGLCDLFLSTRGPGSLRRPYLSVEMTMVNQKPMNDHNNKPTAISGDSSNSATSFHVAILKGGGRVGPGPGACSAAGVGVGSA